ncbi:VOC family protein [Halobacterium sp. CBA1126]|uniref:VOC family protein n=1 Tax=Halobacterium sp. CBA1126 TaxID=2668074 RepID=UPI0012FA1A8A|nr:VOC family protein [Halobacterium sp. CBA1126]MUV59527.1 fosmidomycin resistance protein [Halobacterium sp. CBA1126]
MLSALDSLALEVRSLDRAAAFYEQYLDLRGERRDHEAVYEIGDTTLVLREPSTVPRGGVHVHYAFATTPSEYGAWRDRLSQAFDLVEFDFGSARSIYVDDPDGHCVEIGTGGPDGDGALTGVFEVVLEVEDLPRAVAFYRDLGFAVTDRGGDRERVRLGGPVDLELWEPQLGIADARGAVHADLGFVADSPTAAADAVADRACLVADVDRGVRVRDPDGHYLTFTER